MRSALKNYLVIVGARPNFIKAAPLLKNNAVGKNITFTLLHTGQHFDKNMSDVFFEQMGIPVPDIHLDHTQISNNQLGGLVSEMSQVMINNKFSGVIVFGDVDSTIAGALAAKQTNNKLIHIESGLRSFDKRMPEEKNRVVTDHLSDLLLATEETAVKNLLNEGFAENKIHLVGNLMIESLEMFKSVFDQSNITSSLGLSRGQYFVATIHRTENTSNKINLERILGVINKIATNKNIIMPLHPGTKNKIAEFGLEHLVSNINLIEPVGYIDFIKLVKDSAGVITDSGGIQEETTHLQIPCCTVRDNTERPVTVIKGTNKLFSFDDLSTEALLLHLENGAKNSAKIPFWDSSVSDRILMIL